MPTKRTGICPWGLALSVCLLAVLSCAQPTQTAGARSATLTEYSPESAALFDDVFAPAAFGFDPEARTPAEEPRFRERTRRADFVLPVRVETISRVGGVEKSGSYEVVLAPTGEPLVGEYAGGSLTLNVPTTNPSYGWIEGAGPAWVNARLIVFGKRYLHGTGTALHFRCEPDNPEVRKIIARDAVLRLLR